MNKCCFTGHREISNINAVKSKLLSVIISLIENGVTDFYAGGALGWDMLCEYAVIKLRKDYPNIRLHLVLPCSNEEQTLKWSDEDKRKFNQILSLADTVEYTSERYVQDCMKIRNAKLVELADYCICYYTGRFRSGTGQTVRMAQKKGITIYNLAE